MEIYAQLHPGGPALAPEEAVRILADVSRYGGSAVLVGCLGRRLVSTCTLIVVPNLTWAGAPYALIENVVTDAEHRGRGFAGQVLRHAIAAASRRDCYKVMLMTGSKDPGAPRLYARVGFEPGKTGWQIRRVADRAS